MTNKELREYFGHNGQECRVLIKHDGRVYRHGSDTPTDRSRDYWHYLGDRDQIIQEIEEGRGFSL
jgi:hypothetical protein